MSPRPKVPGGRLFLPPAVLEAALSPRQRAALRILRDQPTGMTAHELGRHVHDHFGGHQDGRTMCDYYSRTGGELAKSLKRAGHVTQHKGGIYKAVVPPPPEEPFEWPAGFGDAS